MKYPLDAATVDEFLGHVIGHERTQRATVTAFAELLQAACNEPGAEDTDWYEDSIKLLKIQKSLKLDHENRRWNEDVARQSRGERKSVAMTPEIARTDYSDIVPSLGPINMSDPEITAKINTIEASFGEEITEEEAARHFGERKPKESKSKPLNRMSLEEINEWEAKQNNSNDIYKVKARVANLARGSGASLTAQGEMLCNTFVHVLVSLYGFAETIEDKSLKIALIEKIRSNEGMPASLIAAAGAGVTAPKDKE